MDDVFSKVVKVLRSSPEKGDEEIYRDLVDCGLDGSVAGRLVVFLPMVYCRTLLEDTGAKFAQTFCRRLANGRVSAERPLSSEPLWVVAFAFARAEIKRGVSAKDLLAVAGRSAEFRAANQLLNKGCDLEDIVFTASVLSWPENEPTPGIETRTQE